MMSILFFAIIIITGALIVGAVIFFVTQKQDREDEDILDS